MIKINEKEFREICEKSKSMAEAAVKLKIHFNTFKRYALKLNCYITNQSGKGIIKNIQPRVDLQEILDGKHPEFQTYKLKNRLLKEGIFKNKCYNENCCVTNEWNGKPINIELDHIDGNRTNHRLDNLKMLCPNCHSQTPTFRAKNIK